MDVCFYIVIPDGLGTINKSFVGDTPVVAFFKFRNKTGDGHLSF